MADDQAIRRRNLREKLVELREAALAELEACGYEVRGKSPMQIRQMLRRHRPSQKSGVQSNSARADLGNVKPSKPYEQI